MFFGYFLNTKKVTPSADFVIAPAKAGAFLFSHTRLPSPPRPLLPFGRISPAAKPGWPVTGPTFWVCRAKSGAAFRCAKPPCAVVRFAAMASPPRTAVLPSPSRLRRAGSPTAKPRPSSFSTRFLLRKNRRSRSLPPLGATCSLPHFRSAQMWPRAPTPALAPVRSHFACGKTGLADHRPHLLELPRKIGRGISLRTPWAAVRFAAMASPPRTVIFPSPPQPRPQRHKAAVF